MLEAREGGFASDSFSYPPLSLAVAPAASDLLLERAGVLIDSARGRSTNEGRVFERAAARAHRVLARAAL